MEYVQVEIRSARNGKDKGAAVVDFGGTIRKDEAGYRFATGRLRPVMINEVEWWFDLSEEDHEHLMNLVSKTGLRRADVNSHAVSRIKNRAGTRTALERPVGSNQGRRHHGRVRDRRQANGGKKYCRKLLSFFPGGRNQENHDRRLVAMVSRQAPGHAVE